MTPPRIICIGTHHKTGTVWMRRLWKQVAAEQDIPFFHVDLSTQLNQLPAEGPVICVNWSSEFSHALWDAPDARFLHVIRDPRDILLSGMRYHRTAPTGNERFLRQKRKDLDGLTYQEHLNALPDDMSRLLFEMLNKHEETLNEMMSWPYGHAHAIDLKYENLIRDKDCSLFKTVLEELALDGLDIGQAVQAYWNNSLFGALQKDQSRADALSRHIKSGQPAQWTSNFPRTLAELYAKRYGKALKTLGYADSRAWVKECAWMTTLPAAEVAG